MIAIGFLLCSISPNPNPNVLPKQPLPAQFHQSAYMKIDSIRKQTYKYNLMYGDALVR